MRNLLSYLAFLSLFICTSAAFSDPLYLHWPIEIPKNAKEIYFQNGNMISFSSAPNNQVTELLKSNPTYPICVIEIGAMGTDLHDAITIAASPTNPKVLEAQLPTRSSMGVHMLITGDNKISPTAFIESLYCDMPQGTGFESNFGPNEMIHKAIPRLFPAIFNWKNN